MFTLQDLWKILNYLKGSGTLGEDIDANLGILSESERAKVLQLFENTLDQICFSSDDYKRIRKFLIDWYASHRTISSVQREASDPFSLPESHLDELIKSFGYTKYLELLPFLTKVNFFLDLVNLYKIKGTPQSIIQALNYYGLTDLELAEYWLKRDPNRILRFYAKRVSDLEIGEPIIPWSTVDFDAMTADDPHWLLKPRLVAETAVDANKIALPSKSPYFGVRPRYGIVPIEIPLSIVARIIDDQYKEWLSTGNIAAKDVKLSDLAFVVSLLELWLGCTYTFQRLYNATGTKNDSKYLIYQGTKTDIQDMVDEWNDLIQIAPTKAIRDARYLQWTQLFTDDINNCFLKDALAGSDINASAKLQLINSELKSVLDDWFIASKGEKVCAILLKDLASWISENVGPDYPNIAAIMLGFATLTEIMEVINFFKPYRARLSVLEMAYLIENPLADSLIIDNPRTELTDKETIVDFVTGDSAACAAEDYIPPADAIRSDPAIGEYRVDDIYVDTVPPPPAPASIPHPWAVAVYSDCTAVISTIVTSTPPIGYHRATNMYLEPYDGGLNKKLVIIYDDTPASTPDVSTSIISQPPPGGYKITEVHIDAAMLFTITYDAEPYVGIADSTALLYYSRETYDCGSRYDIGIVTDLDSPDTFMQQEMYDLINCHGDTTSSGAIDFSWTPPTPTPPFSATSVAGMILWYKADAITGLSDGDPVNSWEDQSGNGLDIGLGIAPEYKINIINGLPVVRFDRTGSEHLYRVAAPLQGPNFTAFIVTRMTATDQNWTMFGLGDRSTDNGWDIGTNSSKRRISYWDVGNWDDDIPTTNWEVWSVDSGGAGCRLWINGNSVAVAGGVGQPVPPTSFIAVGCRNDQGASFFDGDIAEIILYDGIISDADRVYVESYLDEKYGLGDGGPTPTDSTAYTHVWQNGGFADYDEGLLFDCPHGKDHCDVYDLPMEILQEDLVLWWKCDEGSGLTLLDSSGNNRNGTIVSPDPWKWPGPVGQSLVTLDQNDSTAVTYIQRALSDTTGDFVIQFWARRIEYFYGTQVLMSLGNTLDGVVLARSTPARRRGAWTFYNGARFEEYCYDTIPFNTWQHYVMVCKSTDIKKPHDMKLFVNGEQADTCSFQNLSLPIDLIFGARNNLDYSISIQVGGVALYGGFAGGIPDDWWNGTNAWLNYMIEKYRYKL